MVGSAGALHYLSCTTPPCVQRFWPFLVTCSLEYQPYVVGPIYFPDPSGIFTLGCYKDSLIGSDKFNSAVLAVRIDARAHGI